MIGTQPMSALAPLDYRYALDAAMTLLTPHAPALVRCDVPVLIDEILQRFPTRTKTNPSSGLWVEPLNDTWQATLDHFAAELPAQTRLVIIASRPLARLLPERRGWEKQPLGLRLRGLAQFRQALRRTGFVLEASYGLHTPASIGLNLAAQQLSRLDLPDLADRLGFAARLRYCTTGSAAALATVALLVARKEAR